MALPKLTRNFSLSYADVLSLGDNIHSAGTRDLTEIEEYGITALFLTELHDTITACIAITPDNIWVVEVALANQNAYAAAATLRNKIRGIAGRAAMKWTDDGLQTQLFGTGKISRQSGHELLRVSDNVASKGTRFMADLAGEGLLPAHVTALNAAADDYRAKLQEAQDKRDERRVAGQERIAAFNALYEKIVRLSHAGKLKFEFTDAARYQDYLLTERDEAEPLETPVIVSVEGGVLTIEADPEAASHDLEESVDQTTWTLAEDDFTGNTAPVEPPITGVKYFRVISKAGQRRSAYSAIFALAAMLDAPDNPHFNAQTGTFEWGAAAGATRYQMRYRAVGSNDAYTDVFDDNLTSYGWTPPAGEWEFQMRSADDNGNFSPWVTFVVVIG